MKYKLSLSFQLIFFLMLGITTACSLNKSPRDVVQKFANSLMKKDFINAAEFTDDKATAEKNLKKNYENINPRKIKIEVGKAIFDKDFAEVNTKFNWIIDNSNWQYETKISLVKKENNWIINWNNKNIYETLSNNQNLNRIPLPVNLSSITDFYGKELMTQNYWYKIIFNSKNIDNLDLNKSLKRVFDILNPFIKNKSLQEISENITTNGNNYIFATLNFLDYKKVENQLKDIKEIFIEKIVDLFSTNEEYDLTYLNRLKQQKFNDINNPIAWKIVSTNEFGKPIQTLFVPKTDVKSNIQTTIDEKIFLAAQRAVNTIQDKAVIISIIQPSTGKIVSLNHNKKAQMEGLLAGNSLFPPGSTFKILTAAAALESKKYNINSTVPCPGTMEISTRIIPNYGKFDLGNVSLETAFANSCNTSFAKISTELDNTFLSKTAKKLDFGTDLRIDGLETITGKVPNSTDIVQKAENGFGQGVILSSVFGMSLVSAEIKAGKKINPYLINNSKFNNFKTDIDILNSSTYAELKQMMKSVVNSGTAVAINTIPDVYGKTGEAEFVGGSHAWFTGFKEDLAFSVFIENGGSSESAVTITKLLLESVG